MRVRWYGPMAALMATVLAAPVQAGGKNEAVPAVVLRVRSLDALRENLRLLVKVVGEEDNLRQIEGLLSAKAGVKGLEGIDTARPIGAYLRFGKEIDDVSGAVLIPIADEKTFLDLLDRLNITATKGKGDIYTLTLQTPRNVDLFFRFSKGYAYITGINSENLLPRNLLDPKQALDAGPSKSIVSMVIRPQRFPEGATLYAKGSFEQELQKVEDQAPKGETPAQKTFRVTLLREMARIGITLLDEGAELRLDLNVDPEAKEASAGLSLTAQPGSELADALRGLGQQKSAFAGLLQKGQAFGSLVDVTLPEALHKALSKVIDDTTEKALQDIRDEGKRKQTEQLFAALTPTLKSGHLSGAFVLDGPTAGKYTLLLAVGVRDGDKLGKTLRGLVEDALADVPEAQKSKIRLDVFKAGGAAVHRFELPDNKGTTWLQQTTGSRDLHIAFLDDAVFLAVGTLAQPALQAAISDRTKSATPLFLANLDVARAAPLLAKTPAQKELAQKRGESTPVRITVTGGDALSFRLHLDLRALEFLAKMKDGRRQP